MKLEDGIHEIDKIEPISSIEDRVAAYVKGVCFHGDRGDLNLGDKVVVQDSQVEAKIEPLPEVEEAEL